MKYITLEELENRKKILSDRRKKIEKQLEKDDKDKEFKLTMAFNSSLLHDIDCIIGEISFLIDYCNMKQEQDTKKSISCVKCKHFIKCREYAKNNCLFMWGDYCARFEEGNEETEKENIKWFNKHLEENYNISKERK